LVKVLLQVQHGKKTTTTISSAPPGCSISEVVAGKTYITKTSSSGKASLRILLSKAGVLRVTIGGTQFKPNSADVT